MTVGLDTMELKLTKSTEPAVSGPDDETLVDRLRQGESRAGDLLAERYAPALMRYLHRLCGSEHQAEELHQQTWLSVLDHIDRFDPRATSGGFKAWLFRIATNKAHDHWRSRGREKVVHERLRLVYDDRSPDASHSPEVSEQAQKLHRAIQQLPDAQREVLLLRYYSDLKFVEIAEMLGCPLNTALGRMHKAMLKLKELMH
jgi:RNA polymerase sigma-70 factor (ECF subfamily)